MSRIVGGYILQPRIIDGSDIMSSPPCVRETWSYLLREANSFDSKYGDFDIKRGQLFRNYQEIRDALSWTVGSRIERYSEGQMKRALKFLRETERITTRKYPRGILVTICKYDFYQNPKNYETPRMTLRIDDEQPDEQLTNSLPINKNKEYISIYLKGESRLIFESLKPLMDEILEDQACIEDLQRSSGQPYPTSEEVQEKVKEFFVKLTVDGEHQKERKDAIYHFKSWIKTEKQQTITNRSNNYGKEKSQQQPIGAGITFVRANTTPSH